MRNLSPAAFQRDQAARAQSGRILRDAFDRGLRSGVFTNPDFDAVNLVFWSLGVSLARWYPYARQVKAEDLVNSIVDIALRIVGLTPDP